MSNEIVSMIYLCIMGITGLMVIYEMLYGMHDD